MAVNFFQIQSFQESIQYCKLSDWSNHHCNCNWWVSLYDPISLHRYIVFVSPNYPFFHILAYWMVCIVVWPAHSELGTYSVYSKKGGRSCALRSAFCAFFARIFPLFSLGKHFGFFFMKGPSYFQSGLKVLSEQTCCMYYIWNWINVGQVFIENTTVKSHKNNI